MKGLLILASCVALASCATAGPGGLTPDQVHQLVSDFHNAGCGGRVDLDAGAATGQVGGEAHVQLGLHGECPVAAPGSPQTPVPPLPATTLPGDASGRPGAPGGLNG